MSDERLIAVARALAEAASAPPGPDGKRRLPVVQPRDAADLVMIMHAQMDAAVERRTEDAAAQGLTIACTRGCAACCTLPVVVGDAEAIAIAAWLRMPEHAAARGAFEAAYPAWRAALGSIIEDVEVASASTVPPEERRAASLAYRARPVMCAFNQGGDCTIYAVRPAVCRKAHALRTPDHCADNGGQVEYFAHAAVEDTYLAQENTRMVLQHALRPDRPHEVLGKAVMRRLAAATAGRNDPCVCGSGRKLKKCCGA